MKPSLYPTVGIQADTVKFFAEAQFNTDTADITISNYGLEVLNINQVELNGTNFQILIHPA
ncbi:MAG TPA: hypothetical protein VIH28_09095, partial [Ignavibacteriaceae bacterium]